MKTEILSDDRTIKIMLRIQRAYFVLICICVVGYISLLLKLSEGATVWKNLEGIIPILIFLIIYIGLKLRKKWFVPFVLLVSILILINSSLYIFQPIENMHGLFLKACAIMFFIFFAYQMYFFSRKEVKAYFGVKETFFF